LATFKAPLVDWLSDLGGLFFPRRCASCDRALLRLEEVICSYCMRDLPLARAHDDPGNKVEQLFQGKVQLHAATSLFLFNRAGVVQRILHRLKYKGDIDLGIELGKMMARDIEKSERFKGIDLLMPVPLHPKRERMRGYNQSAILADGMGQVMHLKVCGNLKRVQRTASQTRKGRLARWKNVEKAFQLEKPETLEGKHVLLIDDVITTGATVESCIKLLQQVPGIKVSLYACAIA
jgi:ComF family protein